MLGHHPGPFPPAPMVMDPPATVLHEDCMLVAGHFTNGGAAISAVAENTEEVERKPHRSISQMSSYARCSEAYRLERRTDVKGLPAGWFVMGTATHEAIEEWEKSGRELSDEETLNIFSNAYITEANRYMEDFPDEDLWMTGGRKKGFDDLEDREAIGLYQVEDYLQWARSEEDFWEVIHTEHKFTIELGGVEVLGYIDQVKRFKATGEIYPADLKSGTSLPDSNIQLAVYARALAQEFDQEVTLGEWLKLGRPERGRTKQKAVESTLVDLSKQSIFQMDNLNQMFADLERGIESQVYLPNPANQCWRTCGVADYCRALGDPDKAASKPEGLLPLTVKQ